MLGPQIPEYIEGEGVSLQHHVGCVHPTRCVTLWARVSSRLTLRVLGGQTLCLGKKGGKCPP
jgi:hypothetical protein